VVIDLGFAGVLYGCGLVDFSTFAVWLCILSCRLSADTCVLSVV
jgi:hypothetical protein